MKVMLCENADWLLSEEAFSIYASCMYHPTYKDYKGQMDDLLCDPSTKVFVYEDQGRKTGMIILKFSDAAAEIIGIAVSVDARRKGIGKQLIRRVMELDDMEFSMFCFKVAVISSVAVFTGVRVRCLSTIERVLTKAEK